MVRPPKTHQTGAGGRGGRTQEPIPKGRIAVRPGRAASDVAQGEARLAVRPRATLGYRENATNPEPPTGGDSEETDRTLRKKPGTRLNRPFHGLGGVQGDIWFPGFPLVTLRYV